MKALLYSDWCAIRSTLVRILLACLIVACPLVFMSNGEAEIAPGVFAASIVTIMIVFYAMLGLFGSDEQLGWEEARLALPFTTRHVVRARYLFLALCALASALVGTLSGIAANVLLSAFTPLNVPRGISEIAGTALGIGVTSLAYISFVIPLVFKMGMSKSRMFFSAVFLLPLLFNIEPVRVAASGAVGWLEGMSATLGSPVPLIAAWLVLCAAVYLVSMLISERVYATRDF